MQNEVYSDQASPLAVRVTKKNASKSNRINKELYRYGIYERNADCVGAYNILRLYEESIGIVEHMDLSAIRVPYVKKAAV